MSIALENARLFAETEQRAAELQIINSVEEGLASKLDIQAIYELVGDKIREIFHDMDAEIRIHDPKTNLIRFPYITDMGKRIVADPMPLTDFGISSYVLRTGQTLLINENILQEMEKYGSKMVPGGHQAKSAVFVPLVVSNQARGLIVLGDVEHEHAFSETDVRLLQTLANSMSTALQNARLFDESQSLLQETEQRAAELQIINSVQAGLAEGLASKRDIQVIYDLVGDKILELFPNTDTEIRIYDPKTNLFQVPYYIENGQRVAVDPISLSDARMSAHVLRTGQTLVVNENIFREMEKYGAKMMHGRRYPAKSMVFVPLLVGNQARGLIVLNNVEREHAFSDSDVRLLQTLANSMSTALENARLFDEVQKKNAEITEALERETASNDILRVIAESPTDIQPVLEVIARNAAQLSGSDDAIITLRDGDILRVDAHYGKVPTFPVGEGLRFNRDSVAGRAILEGHPLQGIHNQRGVKSEYPEGDKAAKKYGYRMTCAVPLTGEGKAIGAISIRRIKPELLTEKQIALVQSFANQAAIAVENVRLFNETTRLLKETEQRNAELAIINSVQEGLASKLDMQAIYDLVGDKIRDLFNPHHLWILTFDQATRTRRVRYSFEKGQRYYTQESFPYNKLTEYLIETRKPLVINQNFTEAIARFEMANIVGTLEQAKSVVYVPIMAGEEVKGFISLQNVERENAFSESDVNLLSTFASSMSITLENIRLFDETQRLLKETEQANQAKSAFLSSMSHELRTPLNAIINFVEMVARGMIGPVNQEQVELLDQALYSSKHLLNLINDVLDISKIQAGQLTLFVEDQVSVQVEVEAALSIAGGLLQEKGLQLVRDVDPHLPLVSCDRRRLRQVLLNLISNAIKFTNEGTVTVSVKNKGQEVLFAVIDTGPGIPSDKLNLIFEPFIQAENGESQVHGTGLGLPISRSLVRAHGGELWVDSEHGEGSAFFFTLPVDRRSTP
jgi:signal transduction histidine kinase